MNLLEKSKLAPVDLSFHNNYYQLGDKLLRTYLVVELPKQFYLGMLSYYTSNPNIKVDIRTKYLKIDAAHALNKEYKEKQREWQKTKDIDYKERLRVQLSTMQDFISATVNNNDKTLDFIMTFSVHAYSLEGLNSESEDLKNQLRNDGYRVELLASDQENLLKYMSALFTEKSHASMIDSLKNNIGVPLTTNSFAGLFPYTFQTLKDEEGFLFGKEMNNHGIVLLDLMLYKHNPKLAKLMNRLTGNLYVAGKSGSGKTTAINLIVRWLILMHFMFIWVDPENKNKYLTRKYGGSYIEWGKKGNIINIFDLKPISMDEDEEDDEILDEFGIPKIQHDPYDTELAIFNVIDEVKQFIILYKPEINRGVLDIIGKLIVELYERKGITKQTNFRTLEKTDFPIWSDFLEMIEEKIVDLEKQADNRSSIKRLELLEELSLKLESIVTEHKYFFNGHTTVSIDPSKRGILAFGTKVCLNKPKELSNAMNYIMFTYVKSLCLDPDIRSASLIDEGHHFVLDGQNAEEVAVIYRRSRKYNNLSILGDQEPGSLSQVPVHGKAIINNSTYKLILQLEKDALNTLNELIHLTDSEVQQILNFQQGDALLIAGDKHLAINILASDKELQEMDPENGRVFK